jgi:hypothetical protein
MGRPRKQIDEPMVELLASVGCSEKEIALVLNCSDDLLQRRFSPALEKGWAHRNVNLRKLQYEAAQNGSVPMMIWLGRQWLHQRDQPELEKTTDALDELLAEFRKQHEHLKNGATSAKEPE